MAELKKDRSAPDSVTAACMLDCVCNADGSFTVTADPTETADVILEHRRNMARVPVKLSMSEDVVYEALCDVSTRGTRIAGDSATTKTASEPDCFWRVCNGVR